MLQVAKDVNLNLWDAAGFFRLLSCWLCGEIEEYRKYNDSLVGTRYTFREVTRQEDYAGVYILYFHQNGKFYIGSSWSMASRVSKHVSMLRKYKHSNSKMKQAYKDNGDKDPLVLFIVTFSDKFARTVEQRLLDLVFWDPYCLNKTQMVEEYRPETKETKELKRDKAQKQWSNPEFRKKIKEIYAKPENLARRIANAQRNANDPEYRKKIGEASRRVWQDPEYVAKQRESGAAVWKEEGFKERHAVAMRTKWADPEYKARVSAKRGESQRKSIVINGVTYSHAGEAAKVLGISETSARRKADK